MQERKPAEDARPQSVDKTEIGAELARLAADDDIVTPGIGARLRNYFLTGLVVVGPVTITIYIAWYFINVVDAWVKPYIPKLYNPESYVPFAIPGLGLVFAIIGLTMIGALAANLIGRSRITAVEVMLGRMPIVRNLYRAVKQIFESVVNATGPEQPFQKVAVMEFPSKGIWSLVIITGKAAPQIAGVRPDDELISVFMPTHFVPPSGFLVFVPRSTVTPIDMTFEEAAKIILSAGLVSQQTQSRLRDLVARKASKAAPADQTGRAA